MRPLHNYLVVEREKRPEKIGSLYIPNLLNETSQRATVIAAGPGKYVKGKLKPCCAKEGDRVLLIKHAGIAELDGQVLIQNDDILMIEATVAIACPLEVMGLEIGEEDD